MRSSIARATVQSLTLASLIGLVIAAPVQGQLRNPRRPATIGPPPPLYPAPLPKQPNAIRRDLYYRFSNYSMESYNLMSFNQLDRYVSDDRPRMYAMDGIGIRLNYRYRPAVALTMDLTQSLYGGPFRMSTFELGARFQPGRLEYRVRPFVDVHGSWAMTSDTYAQAVGSTQFAVPTFGYVAGYTRSNGPGGFLGTGMDYGLSRNLALTSELGVSHHRMGSVSINGRHMSSDWDYNSTAVRFIIGLKYTGGRWMQQDPSMVRAVK